MSEQMTEYEAIKSKWINGFYAEPHVVFAEIGWLLSEVKKWKQGCQDLAEEQDKLEAEVKRLQESEAYWKHAYDLELAHSKQAETEIRRLREGIEKEVK